MATYSQLHRRETSDTWTSIGSELEEVDSKKKVEVEGKYTTGETTSSKSCENERQWSTSISLGNVLNYCASLLLLSLTRRPTMTHRSLKRHSAAFTIAFFFGALPIALFISLKQQTLISEECTVYGWGKEAGSYLQGLFTIDVVWNPLPFWAAKLVDVAWDLLIGRGVQCLFGYLSYLVFSNALLRAIETSAAPFRMFVSLTLDSCSLSTIVYTFKDLARLSTARHRLLFATIGIASLYVLALPLILGAMTGYVNLSLPYMKLATGELVPYDQFIGQPTSDYENHPISWPKNQDLGIEQDICVLTNQAMADANDVELWSWCPSQWGAEVDDEYGGYWCKNGTRHGNGTFRGIRMYDVYSVTPKTCVECNRTLHVTLGETNLHLTVDQIRNVSRVCEGLCHNNTCYEQQVVEEMGVCLPPTNTPIYQWGFSQNLVGVFVIVQIIWTYCLYFVWLDAELNSEFVMQGYTLSRLRAVLVIAAAAQDTTSLDLQELLSQENHQFRKQISGKKAVVGKKSLG